MHPSPGIGVASALVAGLFATIALAMSPSTSSDPVSRPILPRLPQLIDTHYVPPTGRTTTVRAGGDLQAALDAAQPGDVLSLEAGSTFRGNFRLPKKEGSGWIVIRSSIAAAQLPPPGTRITPGYGLVMPKLVTPNQLPVIQTAPGAHRYRFVGVEFTLAQNVSTLPQIVAFGGAQSTLEDTPSNLILDRCYIHGHSTADVFRGVLLNSATSAIVDSYISEIHVSGHDSQAILGYNGPGPFKIVNNYLEAAGENIMFGGGDPRIPNLVPSDIEIRRNHLFKPLKWRRGERDFVGIEWTVKNLLELKNSQRVVIEGNVLENVWVQAQGGAALVLTPRNGGTAPWSVVQDVMVRNNIVRNAIGAFGGQSTDDGNRSRPMRRVAIVNNLWLSIDRMFFTMAVPSAPMEDLLVDHNTAIPTRYFSYDLDAAASPALVRFQFTNNLTGFGTFGVKFPRTEAAVARWSPDAVISGNALVSLGEVTDGREHPGGQPWEFATSRYVVLSSAAAAGLKADGTLDARSPLKGVGINGKDPGVNFEELHRVMGERVISSDAGISRSR
jgi:hypothetical protein